MTETGITLAFVCGLLLPLSGQSATLPARAQPNPNRALHYLSRESLEALEKQQGTYEATKQDLEKDTKFILWTREGGSSAAGFSFNSSTRSEELLANFFNPKRNTKVISHGFHSGPAESLVAAYFEEGGDDFNVIAIDWSELSQWNYLKAARNSIKVGQHAGRLLGQLIVKELGASPKSFHYVGHSLGAHLGGHFGRTIAETTGMGKIARITALDPAAPWFDIVDEDNRVNKEDADLVDVIHTNSGSLLEGGLSFKQNLGHIDFYPNGGSHQPGCGEVCLGWICSEWDIVDWMEGGCSHKRSIQLYTASISHGKGTFLSQMCANEQLNVENECTPMNISMGEHLNPLSTHLDVRVTAEGSIFFLPTSDVFPYACELSHCNE